MYPSPGYEAAPPKMQKQGAITDEVERLFGGAERVTKLALEVSERFAPFTYPKSTGADTVDPATNPRDCQHAETLQRIRLQVDAAGRILEDLLSRLAY